MTKLCVECGKAFEAKQDSSSHCSDCWNTPPEILSLVHKVAPIGLDPCSNSNSLVGAAFAYDLRRGENGLLLPWAGLGLVFVNPPYSRGNIDQWAARISKEALAGVEIIALVNNCSDTDWWATLAKASPLYCYPKGRLKFLQGGKTKGVGKNGSALLYFGPQRKKFARVFSSVGEIQELVTIKSNQVTVTKCEVCSTSIEAKRNTRKTCSSRCRIAKHRIQNSLIKTTIYSVRDDNVKREVL